MFNPTGGNILFAVPQRHFNVYPFSVQPPSTLVSPAAAVALVALSSRGSGSFSSSWFLLRRRGWRAEGAERLAAYAEMSQAD